MNTLLLLDLAVPEEWKSFPLWNVIFGGLELLLWLTAGLFVLVCFSYLLYLLISAGLRRQERARCFLQLLETGFKQGRSFENTIVTLAQSRDQTLGVYFHLLAAYVEQGCRMTEALARVPHFLPPQINAMLQAGEEIREPTRVLAACRSTLQDGVSQSLTGQNTLTAVLFLLPFGPVCIWMTMAFVAPRFKEIYADMAPGLDLPFVVSFSYST